MIRNEREYAEALFALAAEESAVQEYQCALATLRQLLEENPDYIEFLASPATELSERLSAIDEAFEGRMPEYVVSFLKVLCGNGKIRILPDALDEFDKLALALSKRSVATIYSALPLTEGQKNALCQKLEGLTGKGIDPIYIINESLIGGVKIELDGKTFDGSIRHRLDEIKDVISL